MYEMLRAKNSGLKKEVIEFARNLIRTKSESLCEQNVADLVEKEMKNNGYDRVIRDRAGNVAGVILGRKTGPNVLLTSHMDTVSVDDITKWTFNPYEAEIKDGKLYGRGASDCKAGIAAQVYAGILIKRSLLPLHGNIVVAATVAEQNGLSVGTKFFMSETLPELGIKPDIAILGEPTYLGIYYGHDGWMTMKIYVESSNSFNVSDAVTAIKEELLSTGTYDSEIGEPVFKNLSSGCKAEIDYHTRLNASAAPDTVIKQVEHRATMAAKLAGSIAVSVSVKKEEQTLYTGHRIMTQFITNAWGTDPFHPMIERARQVFEAGSLKIKMSKWKLGSLGMGTAGYVILNQFKVPVFGYGPGTVEQAHAIDEYIEIEKLCESVYGSTLIAHGITGIPVCGWTLDEI